MVIRRVLHFKVFKFRLSPEQLDSIFPDPLTKAEALLMLDISLTISVSSVYAVMVEFCTQEGNSFAYSKSNTGLRIEPRGRPVSDVTQVDDDVAQRMVVY
jgi:hypothetical protein